MASILRFDKWQNSNGSTYGAVLNVYYVKSSATQTITANTPTAINGLSISVTPSVAGSKFLVTGFTNIGGNGTYTNNRLHIFRDNTSLIECSCYEVDYANNSQVDKTTLSVLDQPPTNASVTYGLYAACANNGSGIFINAHASGVANTIFGNNPHTQASENGGGYCWLQVMEIAG